MWLNIPREFIRDQIPIYSAIGMSMSKDSDLEGLKLAASNCPEDYYKRNKE
jgi:hypothetical protein